MNFKGMQKQSSFWRASVTCIKLQKKPKKHVSWNLSKCEQKTRWLGGTDVIVKLIFTKKK